MEKESYFRLTVLFKATDDQAARIEGVAKEMFTGHPSVLMTNVMQVDAYNKPIPTKPEGKKSESH